MLDLSKNLELRQVGAVVADLQRVAPDIDCMLIGATARDLHLHYAHAIPAQRATRDIDFAIAIQDWGDFNGLLMELRRSGAFQRDRVPHRLRHTSGYPLDLVPYGGIETADREIHWPPDGSSRMHMSGYREARVSAVQVHLPAGVRIAMPSLAGLLVLKCFAFRERGATEYGKDADDIHLILRSYLDAGQRDRLFADFIEVLETPDFDYRTAGAFMAGHDAKVVLSEGNACRQLRRLIDDELNEEGPSRLLGQVRDSRQTFRELLRAFGEGLRTESPPSAT